MKNLILLPLFATLFAIVSLAILAMMVFLVFIPRLLLCLNLGCIRRYKRRQQIIRRAGRIKKARMILAYKAQITGQSPLPTEIDQSQGYFVDSQTGEKTRDRSSLQYLKEKMQTVAALAGPASAKQEGKGSPVKAQSDVKIERETKPGQVIAGMEELPEPADVNRSSDTPLTGCRQLLGQLSASISHLLHQMKDHYSH